jgi:hypothetical protein
MRGTDMKTFVMFGEEITPLGDVFAVFLGLGLVVWGVRVVRDIPSPQLLRNYFFYLSKKYSDEELRAFYRLSGWGCILGGIVFCVIALVDLYG